MEPVFGVLKIGSSLCSLKNETSLSINDRTSLGIHDGTSLGIHDGTSLGINDGTSLGIEKWNQSLEYLYHILFPFIFSQLDNMFYKFVFCFVYEVW